MNDRSLAISILQNARDRLGERLTQRIIESRQEIAADADGGSYLSEIETIYDQLGGRLAHVNAMLSNLPPQSAQAPADATATEIIYADLASAYPTGLDLESAAPPPMLALPAPTRRERTRGDALSEALRHIAAQVDLGDVAGGARTISECFDVKPSKARRWATALARQIALHPDLSRRLAELAGVLDDANEHATASLVAECFEAQPIEALSVVRSLKKRLRDVDLTK